MNRRELIALMAGAAAMPSAARAQPRPTKIPRIGIIDDGEIWKPFRDGLREAGYSEGQTIAFETRAADGNPDRLSAAAAELARLPVDLIATYGTPASRAAKAATTTIPIVAISVGDPVRAGLVQNLAHPGGNVTGFTDYDGPLAGKWLEMLTQVAPPVRRVFVVYNPETAPFAPLMLRTVEDAAQTLHVAVEPAPVNDAGSIAALATRKDGGFLVLPDFFTMANRAQLLATIGEARLPAVFWSRTFVEEGGLMSYSTDSAEQLRRAASYIDRILRGALAADLPVQNPTRFELTINLKTAKALGVTLPAGLLAIANDVIE